MVTIADTWGKVATAADCEIAAEVKELPLSAAPGFDDFQAGRLPWEAYLQGLAAWTSVNQDVAEAMHNGILCQQISGADRLVRELRDRGLHTGCLSNTNQPHWARMTSGAYPAIDLLETKVASHQIGLEKPDLAIYRHYEAVTGFAPHEIVLFDDTEANVVGAAGAGWKALLIDRNGDSIGQMRKALSELTSSS